MGGSKPTIRAESHCCEIDRNLTGNENLALSEIF